MAASKETFPAPTVVLPVGNGRVEVSVVDNEIWLSDYSNGETRNFTLVIPRQKLQGTKSARQAVFDHHCNKGGGSQYKPSPRIAAAAKKLTTEPPACAGFWYELPSPAHGGPVVIVEE